MKTVSKPERPLTLSARTRPSVRTFLGTITTLLATTLSAQPETATVRDKQPFLEEIIVTAQRRSESIQDVAIGMSAVTAQDLEKQGISDFSDLNKAVAGLHLEAEAGFASASIRIRGVGTAGLTITDPSVGVVLDGVYQSRIGTAFTDLLGVERIEVLRGPQGTLFGKNTTAGVINVVTKRPDTESFAGKAQLIGGNFKNGEARGEVNVPLLENTLVAGLSAYNVEREGHNTNKFRDIDTRGENRYGFRGKVLYTPTDNLDVYLIGDFKKTDTDIDASLARYGTYDFRTAPGGIPAPVPPPGDPQGRPIEEVAAEQGKPLPPVRPFSGEAFEDAPHSITDTFESGTLQLDWAIFGHTLSSITGYQEIEDIFIEDSDSTPLDLMSLDIVSIVRSRTQELRIASDDAAGNLLDYVVGAFYQEEDVDTSVLVFDGDDAAAIESRNKREDIPVRTLLNSEAIAGFAHLTLNISEAWEGVLGVRRSTVDKFADSSLFLDLGTPTNLAVPPTNVRLIPGLSDSFSATTYTAKVKHYFSPEKMVYLSVDRGFKTGGFNLENVSCPLDESTCIPEDLKRYDPEFTLSTEIGWKTELFDRRLRLNGAVFYQTYKDFQVNVPNPEGSIALVSNASDVTARGVELDFAGALSNHWAVNGSFAWIRSTYDDYPVAPCPTTQSKDPACRQDLSGKQLDNAPEWTLNLGLEYSAPLNFAEQLHWHARANASYRGDTFLLATQSQDSLQAAYTVYGARLGLGRADERWKVELWSNNLTDEDYVIVVDRPTHHTDGANKVRGLPRTAGLSLTFTF